MIKKKTIKHKVVHHQYTAYEEEQIPILKTSQYGPWKKRKSYDEDDGEWVRYNLIAKKPNYSLTMTLEGPCIDRDEEYWEVEMYYFEELPRDHYNINTVFSKEFKTKEGALKCVEHLLKKYRKQIPRWKR